MNVLDFKENSDYAKNRLLLSETLSQEKLREFRKILWFSSQFEKAYCETRSWTLHLKEIPSSMRNFKMLSVAKVAKIAKLNTDEYDVTG